MTPLEAADIIHAVAESLRTETQGFSFAVHVTQTGFNVAPGSTVNISASNTGDRAHVVAANISLDGGSASVQFEQRAADAAISAQFADISRQLGDLAQELRNRRPPDGSRIKAMLAKLGGTIIPAVAQAAVNAALTTANLFPSG